MFPQDNVCQRRLLELEAEGFDGRTLRRLLRALVDAGFLSTERPWGVSRISTASICRRCGHGKPPREGVRPRPRRTTGRQREGPHPGLCAGLERQRLTRRQQHPGRRAPDARISRDFLQPLGSPGAWCAVVIFSGCDGQPHRAHDHGVHHRRWCARTVSPVTAGHANSSIVSSIRSLTPPQRARWLTALARNPAWTDPWLGCSYAHWKSGIRDKSPSDVLVGADGTLSAAPLPYCHRPAQQICCPIKLGQHRRQRRPGSTDASERLGEIGDEVVDVLNADGGADGGIRDAKAFSGLPRHA